MPEIIIVNSKQPQKITTVYITPEKMLAHECLIGRDEKCCIVLQDSLVSRIHGKITFQNGNYYYNDLGSRNGSRLNNQLINKNQNYPLNPFDSLNLGFHLLWIKSVSEIKTNPVRMFASKKIIPSTTTKASVINHWNQEEITVRCVEIISESDRVKTFSFVAEPSVLFTYQPGQFAIVELEIEGKTIKRCYSLSSSPSRPYKLELTIPRLSSSTHDQNTDLDLADNWLYDRLLIGSEVKIKSITGEFSCFKNPAPKLLFISAGSGIIPLMSMARWLCDTAAKVDLIFCHSARSIQDLIFLAELELMAAKHPNFKLAITITRPKLNEAWLGYTGRLNNSMLSIIAPDYQARNVYACGSNSFLLSMKSWLSEMNFPMKNYYEEQFCHSIHPAPIYPVASSLNPNQSLQQSKIYNIQNCSKQLNWGRKVIDSNSQNTTPSVSHSRQVRYHSLPPLSVVSTPFKPAATEIIPFPTQKTLHTTTRLKTSVPIWLTKSEQVFDCDRNSSILEAAQAQDIALPHGCAMGVCGHCQVKKLAGEVTYDEDIDCEAGYILTCLAKPVGKVKLEI